MGDTSLDVAHWPGEPAMPADQSRSARVEYANSYVICAVYLLCFYGDFGIFHTCMSQIRSVISIIYLLVTQVCLISIFLCLDIAEGQLLAHPCNSLI